MFNFGKIKSLVSAPGVFEQQTLNFLRRFGKTITKQKSFGSIIAICQKAIVSNKNVAFFSGTPGNNETNLSGSYTRPEGEHFIVTHIKVSEGAAASVNATAWTRGLSTADVINGFYDIVVNGVVEARQLPLTAHRDADNPFAGYYELPEPLIWGGQETLNVNASWATAPATANQNLRVELYGYGLTA